MITGELKSKVDKIWDTMWSGGISNPISVVEQLTYLLFIKRLDELHTLKERKAARLDARGQVDSGRVEVAVAHGLAQQQLVPLRVAEGRQCAVARADEDRALAGRHRGRQGYCQHRWRLAARWLPAHHRPSDCHA